MMLFRRSGPFLLSLALTFSAPLLAAEKPLHDSLTPQEARRRDAVEHFLKARLLSNDSEFEEALREFRKAVELDPTDGNLRREYAEALRDLSVFPEAEREGRKAVELAPSQPGGHRVLGQVLLATAKDKAGLEAAAAELKIANDAQPGDPVGSVAYGQVLLRLEKPEEATKVLERILEKGRGSAIPLLYGEALEKSGQLASAEELYDSILHQEPENRAASVGLLRTYERSKQYDKAVPLFEGFLKAQPANIGLKTQYAALLMRARRFSDSGRILQEVLKSDPGNRDALRQYGTLLSETREPDKADEVLKRLQGLEPDDPDVPFRRALNFLEARRIAEAEKILIELRAQLVAKKKADSELAQVDGQLGYAAFLRKDYEAARTRLAPHLFHDEDGINMQALNLLLQIARDKPDPAEGLRIAREAYKKGPRNASIRSALGEFLFRSKDKAEQEEGAKILASLAGDERGGALAAADTWQRLEQFDRAATTAKVALDIYKEDPDLLFRLAASLERAKKLPESVAAFERLLSVKKDYAPGMNYLGYLWADRGENLPRALALVQKAVELDPTNGAYLDSLGWVYYQLNQLDRAEENLRAAATLNPDDATIEEHMGDVFEKRGDISRARASWKRALTLKPDDGGKKLEAKLKRTNGAAAAASAKTK